MEEWRYSSTDLDLSARFTVPGAHWMGGWVRPRTGVDAVEKREISCPCRELNPYRPTRSPSLNQLNYSGSLTVTNTNVGWTLGVALHVAP
jgi:hypothetical protein